MLGEEKKHSSEDTVGISKVPSMQRNDVKYDSKFIETYIRSIDDYVNDKGQKTGGFIYKTDAGDFFSRFKQTVPFDVPVKIEIRINKADNRWFFLNVVGGR